MIYPRRWCETEKTLSRLQELSRCTASIQKISIIADLPRSFHTTDSFLSDLGYSNTSLLIVDVGRLEAASYEVGGFVKAKVEFF